MGTDEEVTIKELSEMIRDIVGFNGRIECDISKPDGMPRRILDSTKIHALGWSSSVALRDGLEELYEDYISKRG